MTGCEARPSAPPPRRRWCQFSLRTLMIVTVFACIGMSCLGVRMERARRQKEAVQAIQQLGGRASYDWETDDLPSQPPGPAWVRRLLGDDACSKVIAVQLTGPLVTDDDLAHLKKLPDLQEVWIAGTGITDDGAEYLGELFRVNTLDLSATRVGDQGMGRLAALDELRYLDLSCTQVTDDALAHIAMMARLKVLCVAGTRVTDPGVRQLQQTLPNCWIVQ